MLALRGMATAVQGFSLSEPSHVIRLRDPHEAPDHGADVALIRSADDEARARAAGFNGALAIGGVPIDCSAFARTVVLPAQFDYLASGDILGLRPASSHVRSLYRRSSAHNSFLVTERCNHYCLMCSQPPRDVDDRWILGEIRKALPLVDVATRSFAFTGGEPLLDWQDFVEVLKDCRNLLPNTNIHVLTNGRAFAHGEIVSAWSGVKHPHLSAGIPIYSAVDHIHDYVVQAPGALDETVLGVLRLKDAGQRVEIRVVLHAITAPRIVETCRWLARNLSFVDHVALMGLENTGFALANADALWIDPLDYQASLAEGIDLLVASGINVSVYNLTRCVLDRSVWPYAVQSISDWKNAYAEECQPCTEKDRCSGFFTSGRPRRSRGIQPILAAQPLSAATHQPT
jgi:His-Xaa-Ser system radical SAM maturase HxsC